MAWCTIAIQGNMVDVGIHLWFTMFCLSLWKKMILTPTTVVILLLKMLSGPLWPSVRLRIMP